MGNTNCPTCPTCSQTVESTCYRYIFDADNKNPIDYKCWTNEINKIQGYNEDCLTLCQNNKNCLGYWNIINNNIRYNPIRFFNQISTNQPETITDIQGQDPSKFIIDCNNRINKMVKLY